MPPLIFPVTDIVFPEVTLPIKLPVTVPIKLAVILPLPPTEMLIPPCVEPSPTNTALVSVVYNNSPVTGVIAAN